MVSGSIELSTQQMIKTGKLIYLVGPSGAGKDTLINELRNNEELKDKLFISQRYITRPPSSRQDGEQHIALSRDEFLQLQQQNEFALSWQAHGTYYGIRAEIGEYLNSGMHVLVNGSRQYLETAKLIFPNLALAWLRVDNDVLQRRLLARGREPADKIQLRLHRNLELEKTIPEGCQTIDNSGVLQEAVGQFTDFLENL